MVSLDNAVSKICDTRILAFLYVVPEGVGVVSLDNATHRACATRILACVCGWYLRAWGSLLPTRRLKSSVEAEVRMVWKLVDLRLADSSDEAGALRGYRTVAGDGDGDGDGAGWGDGLGMRGASALPPLRLRR